MLMLLLLLLPEPTSGGGGYFTLRHNITHKPIQLRTSLQTYQQHRLQESLGCEAFLSVDHVAYCCICLLSGLPSRHFPPSRIFSSICLLLWLIGPNSTASFPVFALVTCVFGPFHLHIHTEDHKDRFTLLAAHHPSIADSGEDSLAVKLESFRTLPLQGLPDVST
jgi:hypothetical protein